MHNNMHKMANKLFLVYFDVLEEKNLYFVKC